MKYFLYVTTLTFKLKDGDVKFYYAGKHKGVEFGSYIGSGVEITAIRRARKSNKAIRELVDIETKVVCECEESNHLNNEKILIDNLCKLKGAFCLNRKDRQFHHGFPHRNISKLAEECVNRNASKKMLLSVLNKRLDRIRSVRSRLEALLNAA
ncbi:hypothetical protein Q9X96_003452 [Vibrio vulnificus]|nr:hypothetical protein [Vibrio vulnificus]